MTLLELLAGHLVDTGQCTTKDEAIMRLVEFPEETIELLNVVQYEVPPFSNTVRLFT